MPITRFIRCSVLTIFISLLSLAIGCITIVAPGAGPVVTGSGTLETREMDYSDFTKLEVGYAFQVDITKADSFLVSITMDDNLFQYLNIEKRGYTLYIVLEPNHQYRNITHRATITMPDLHELELSGASKGDVSGFSSSQSLELGLSGASSLDINNVEAGDTRFVVSGASRIRGSVDIADGTFNASGASTVELEGTASNVSIHASGASRMRLPDFAVVDAVVNLSGASNCTINASGGLDVDLSGVSRLNYIGNPTLGIISVSGGSTISKR